MGKKERQKRETRRSRMAQREHRGVYGQQSARSISRREQKEIAGNLQEILSSPDRMEENLGLLEDLLVREEELRSLRFDPRETLTLSVRHDLLEKAVLENEELRNERMGQVLNSLVTPAFSQEVSQAIQKTAQRRRWENPEEATALFLARVLLDSRMSEMKPSDNPVWRLLFQLSLNEAISRSEELGIAIPEPTEEAPVRMEELEDYLDSDILHEELDRLLEEYPEILEDYPDFSGDTAHSAIDWAWTGGPHFQLEFPELLHAPLPLSELMKELEQSKALGPETDYRPEERSLEVLQECFAADLTEDLTGRLEAWLNGSQGAPEEAQQGPLLTVAGQMAEMFDPEDNPFYLALYYSSLLRIAESPPEEFEEEIEAIFRNPSDAEAYLDYGEALLDQGQPEFGIRAFQRGLELAPEDFSGHEGIARCHRAQGNLGEARREMERALQKASQRALEGEPGLERVTEEMEQFLQELVQEEGLGGELEGREQAGLPEVTGGPPIPVSDPEMEGGEEDEKADP